MPDVHAMVLAPVDEIVESMELVPRNGFHREPRCRLCRDDEVRGGSVLVEAHDEWQVADKRYLSETTLALLNPGDKSGHIVAASPALTA